MTPEKAKFVLRLDKKLHRKIKRLAKLENTSMNRYIENALVNAVAPRGILTQGQITKLADLIRAEGSAG